MKPTSPRQDDIAVTPIEDPRAQRRACRRSISILMQLTALLVAPCQVFAGEEHQSYFPEPGSGKKVTHYSIDLPLGRGQRQAFLIPDDCETVIRAIDEGSAYKGSIIDRRLWQKAESDCHYDGFLHHHPQQITEDFVSDYDFMNCRISDLPIDRRCADGSVSDEQNRCTPAVMDVFGMPRQFPLTQPIEEAPGEIETSSCEMRDGLFHGRIYYGPEGIHCEADPRLPGMRLIAVDFADVNGDHVLDAVLRFVPIGPSVSRTPLILPLTRNGPDEPFRIPEATLPAPPTPPMPPMPPMPPAANP